LLRSPWFWFTVLLIVAGAALTAALGVLGWFALALATGILIVGGILLHNTYVIESMDTLAVPQLKATADEKQIPVIYDCDLTMGRPFRDVGDGLALLYLLGEPRINLQAITTTYGNGPVDMTTRTTGRLLSQLNLERVRVARGASGPDQDPRENEAAQYLVDHVSARPNEIVLLATGAMTNLKHALALDADFSRKLRSLHLVGSATRELVWNKRRLLERNFSLDPEAAYQAIQADCPTTITLREAGLTAIFRSPQFSALQALDDPVSNLIVRQVRLWFGLMRLLFRDDGFAMWEPIAALTLTHPGTMSLQRAHLPTTVEDLRAGRLVPDPDSGGPVRLVLGVEDYEGFIRTQLAAWHHLGRSIEAKRKGGS
jgi:inosine-uridine nucleoside N-ribohydrolase